MDEKVGEGQSGGVNISGSIGSVGEDIVGRDKAVGVLTAATLDDALRPVLEAIRAAPPKVKSEAEAKLAALKEAAESARCSTIQADRVKTRREGFQIN